MRDSEPWPTLDAIVISHFHLDHWGDLVPWVWGTMFRSAEHTGPELWLPPGGRETLVDHGSRLGFPNMFERVFAEREFEPREPFAVNGIRITTVPMLHYRMPAFGMRVEADGTTLSYSADTGPTEALDGARARRRPLRLRGNAARRVGRRAAPRASVRGRGDRRVRPLGSPPPAAHAPAGRAAARAGSRARVGRLHDRGLRRVDLGDARESRYRRMRLSIRRSRTKTRPAPRARQISTTGTISQSGSLRSDAPSSWSIAAIAAPGDLRVRPRPYPAQVAGTATRRSTARRRERGRRYDMAASPASGTAALEVAVTRVQKTFDGDFDGRDDALRPMRRTARGDRCRHAWSSAP